ncbi:WD40 repeat-like protein [Phytophthora palmivora]|uniref:WD40 repeat-like protein n=1 Tax=Phytophthora palmivora TaxID=4796 RepID=A0A2P4X056_9STRA|nr:WD40 repeat-like protein [Phytophthora palmivora]
MTHHNVGWHTQGDVEQIQDQYIHKNVFKIRGAIAATNYLRVPRDAGKGTHGLGLTGRYAYLQVRRIGDLPLMIHLDFVTNKKNTLRFTLSSIYELFRSTGTALRVPLSLDTRWTVVVVDMVRLLQLHSFNQYARDSYRHLKTITLCASMNVRNFFVSSTLYTPMVSLIHCDTKVDQVPSTGEVEIEFFRKVTPRTRDSNIRRDRNEILSRADEILRDAAGMKQGLRTRIVSSSTKAEWPDPILELDRIIGFSNDFPRMLLWVANRSACIYTSSSTIIFREFCDQSNGPNMPNSSRFGAEGNNRSTDAVKSSLESIGSAIATREHYLYGHCAKICALAVTSNGRLLASAELPTGSKQNGVRLWDLSSHECLTVVKAQPKGVHALCFSTPLKRRLLLCVVGRDECFRTQIFVWDCSCLQHDKEDTLSATAAAAVSLLARQTSDFPIDRVAFSPYVQQDQFHLVSCGRENIRYWRVNPNTGHLTGCPVILNEYSRGTVFTDIGFDTIVETHPSNIHRVRPLYVTSSLGTLLVIDYFSKQVICVYQLHDACINCLSINEGFCVTGSDDCFLRVWPLDFTDFFLEARHEAGVSMLDVSADGMKVLVGSRNNAIGVLDISSQQYATLLRSHTKEITAVTSAPWKSPLSSLILEDARPKGTGTAECELVTASNDGTLRVWDTSSGHQLYEFDIQQERVTSLAASPVNIGIVAVGFASGCTRIFDVHRTCTAVDNINGDSNTNDAPSSMLHEFRQHQSSICHIAFDSDGQHLFTSGAGKQLCLYDSRQQDYLPLKMLLSDFDPEDGRFEISHDNKWLAVVSGDHQDILMLDPCSLRMEVTIRPPKHGQDEALKLARFSNHSTELLVLSTSDRLHIFTLPEREFVQSMPLLGQDGISSLVMSVNAKYMVTGGVDSSLRVWNWDDRGRIGRMHQSFLGYAGKVNELVFTNDGKSIVASGESSAICIWQFHGDSAPLSPRAKSGPIGSGLDANSDSERTNGDPLSSTATMSKANFRLSLETDALKLDSDSETTQHGRIENVLSSKTDMLNSEIPTTVMRTASDLRGTLALHRTIGGFHPSSVVWSHLTGKLLHTTASILAVEDIASGHQTFYNDFSNYERDQVDTLTNSSLDEIVLLQLSPSGESIATVSARFNVVVIRSLITRNENKTYTETNADDDPVLISLPPATDAVTSIAFAQRTRHSPIEELICMACEIGKSHLQRQNLVVVASTTQRRIIWSSVNSSGMKPSTIRQIVAISDYQFLLLSAERGGISTLTFHLEASSSSFGETPEAKIEPLIGVFPTQVQLVSLYNKDGKIDRLRYLVGIDNERYCYFYDLWQNIFIATTQLLLLPSKIKSDSNQVERKARRVSSQSVVEFMEWMTTVGKSLLITGSKEENVLYVHGLPMLSTKHSNRVQMDWQRVARTGISLLYRVAVNGGGLLRSLSVDPARDVGIATTDDGTVVLVHFDASPITKVLKKTSAVGVEGNRSFNVSQVCWALNGAVILSSSKNDTAIRVWLPELSKEIATFQVESAMCTCFAVNPFSSAPDGTPQSMVMAGYSDGSLRVFDLYEMRLLSRFELTPSGTKSTRYDGGTVNRIVFVGPFTALVVTQDNTVMLVDVSNALDMEESQNARGTSVRFTPPKRANAHQCKKMLQERSTNKLKHSVTNIRNKDREAVYRELQLLPSSYIRRRRLQGLAKSEHVHAQVGVIDVMKSSGVNIHPFLVVVKYAGPTRYGEGRCVVKVFGDPTMTVSCGEEISPTDEWRLVIQPNLDQCVASFMADTMRVVYPFKQISDAYHWGLELRDCVQQRVIQRFTFDTNLGLPVQLHNITTSLPDAPEAELMLLVDAQGRMVVFDHLHHRLVPVNSETIKRLHFSCSNSTSLLFSSTQLAVASLTFQ